jgi:tetratricopeptide (TPR) repeat protein
MSDKELYWNMAVIAINGELNKEAKEYLQAAIDKGYQDPNAFVYLANIYLTEGDTASGLKVIEQGRSNFPNTSSLITAEINVYIAQGRVDVLVEKANAAIENSPDNPLLYYVRGNSYQILAESNAKLVKRTNDTLAYFAKQLKSATDPKKKAALNS